MSWAGPNGNNNPFPRPVGAQPFWNFIHSLDPNFRAGAGVDYSANPRGIFPPNFPFHEPDFAFGGAPGGWGPYAAGWGGPRRGRGFGHRGGGGRCRSGGGGVRHDPPHAMYEDPEEVAMRDAEEPMRDAAEEVDVSDKEKDNSPDTVRDGPEEGPEHGHQHGQGRRGRRRFGPAEGGPWRHGRHHHGPHGPHGPRGPHGPAAGPHPFGAVPPPPPYAQPGGPAVLDMESFLQQFASHPFAQSLRDWASRFAAAGGATNTRSGPDFGAAAAANDDHDSSSFTPPVDIFVTDKSYVLHFALPGAKKEDIGVDWDAEKGELRVAGVVYRPGDEDFLATMASSERRVGLFARSVPLPPAGSDREDIDALSITAKMEDGILVVTVPKLEKEWTEIHKVDIE